MFNENRMVESLRREMVWELKGGVEGKTPWNSEKSDTKFILAHIPPGSQRAPQLLRLEHLKL